MQPHWQGVFPAVTTQLHKDESLDLEATQRHLEVLIESGVSGLIMCGSLGENQTLDPAEKRQVVELGVKVARGRIPVLTGVAETSARQGLAYMRDCEKIGVDGFMIMPAMIYKADLREAMNYFRTLSASTKLPWMLYNNPVGYPVDIAPQSLCELADIKNLVAVKESSADPRRITEIHNVIGGRFALFVGVDDLALETSILGIDGWVAGAGIAFPFENQYFWELTRAGRWDDARQLYRWFQPLLKLDTHPKFIQYLKLAVQEAGLGAEWGSRARLTLVGEERERVLGIIHKGIKTRPEIPKPVGRPLMQTEASRAPLRMPRSTWFIVTTEACERFSFYGMTSILTLYLQYQMAMGKDDAKERVHLFNAAVYYLPLLGGWLADKYLGRYRTILFLSLFYCLGHGSLALFEGQGWGIFMGLALIAMGAGAIKPCVSAFVADQFETLDERGLAKVYGIFYWAVNLGATFAFAIIPAVAPRWEDGQKVAENWGYSWAFGIPGIFMAIAALVFLIGTPLYLKRRPQVETDVNIDPQQRTKDRKTLLRIVLALSPIVIFWALFYQTNTSWVQQGETMKPFAINDNYQIDSQKMQAASGILILILVPFMGLVGYPLMRRMGIPTTLNAKIAIGMLMTAFSFCISALLQTWLDGGTKLSILWQLVPYVPLEIGEVMVSVTGLEYAYTYAPARMKSVVMGVWFCITATGNLSVALLTALIGTSTVNADGSITVPDDHRLYHLTDTQQFYFYAVLMLVGAAAFVLIGKFLVGNRLVPQSAAPPELAKPE